MKQAILILIFYIFGFTDSKAQLTEGTYIGKNNSIKLIIESDSNAVLSYRYETSVFFQFECRIIKKSDSTFQLESLRKTMDRIVFKGNKQNDSNIPIINFFTVNRAAQSNPIDINYEIISCSNYRTKSNDCICFLYNHRFYCYPIKKGSKEVKIFIDADNSFLVNNWKVRGKILIPFIHGKESEKWILIKNN